MMRKYNYWNLLCLIPFGLGLYVALNDGIILGFEKGVFDLFRKLAPAADIPMRALTELGSAVGVIAITVLLVIVSLFVKRFLSFGLPIALATIISRVINMLLKNSLMRPRPAFRVIEAHESSFPSGHSQNNMVLYIAVLIALLLIVKAPKLRLWLKIICIALPVIIGLTRIYFGVHYISDVIAGWSVGVLVAYNVLYLYFNVLYTDWKKEDKNAENRV